MKRLQVQVTDGANAQILDQVLYIAADSISNALAWEARLRATLDRLSDFHGHVVDKEISRRLGNTTHKLVFERTYVVHYSVDSDAGFVYVVNFRHARGCLNNRIFELGVF